MVLILNEEAAEFARVFEEGEKEVNVEDVHELNTTEQITLYTLTKMFMRDPGLRLFLEISLESFAHAATNDRLHELITTTLFTNKKIVKG